MALEKPLFVYIVKCADKSYYTGVTNNLEKRIAEHNEGANPLSYTSSRRPVELVYAEVFQIYQQAIALEKQIKGWTRKKKEALIKQNWDKLKELSTCKNITTHRNLPTEKRKP